MSNTSKAPRTGATRRLLLGAGVVLAGVIGYTAFAQAQSCDELWRERNGYYKEYGYCFKTERARREFGNEGCRYYDERDLPMPRGIRGRIAEIVAMERALGCRY